MSVDLLHSILPYILDQFFNGPAPQDIDTWNQNLKLWAVKTDFDPFGVSAKTTRKSIESWILSSGVSPFKVYQRLLFIRTYAVELRINSIKPLTV